MTIQISPKLAESLLMAIYENIATERMALVEGDGNLKIRMDHYDALILTKTQLLEAIEASKQA